MPAIELSQANRQAVITTPFEGDEPAVLTRFTAIERLSEPFVIIADVIISSGFDTLYDKLGDKVSIEVAAGPARSRHFHGRLWEIAELGRDDAGRHYRLTLKPWASFLDMNVESRIYQEMDVSTIVSNVLGRRAGITPLIESSLDGTYPVLEYTVQWQESDFDFLSRMFERHGLYYYFKHAAAGHTLKLVDQKLMHTAVPGIDAAIEVLPYSDGIGRDGGAIWSLSRRFEVAPAKATVTDYDFTTPTVRLTSDKPATAKTVLDNAAVSELYVHPGGFTKALGDNRGAKLAEQIIEAARAETERSSAEGDCFAAMVGATIEIKPQGGAMVKYLIIGTTHSYTGGKYRGGAGDEDELTVEMDLIPATVQYRPPLKTPRPRIYGPQTAIVTGTAGEEIETDQYGRIKVQFHWDREGKKDQNSSCWIRVAQSMAGKTFGGWVLPRIGQEVVVEYLGGDPDQPIVTGSVYNAENMVPYTLPDNKTRSTFKSQSTPNNTSGYNEFRIEDKNGQEEVFFNAEKDLNSTIDKGNETRTLNKGNRTTKIKEGNETLEITKGTRTETIYGNETLTIQSGNRKEEISTGNDTLDIKKGHRTTSIDMGNEELAIKMGNRTESIDMGNDELTLKMGNRTVKLDLGKDSLEAMQSIELKCGMSTFKMTPMSIEMKSMMIKIEGSLMFETKGLMMQQQASAIHIVKGGLVLIN